MTPSATDIQWWRSQFEVVRRGVAFLAHCTVSPLPDAALHAIQQIGASQAAGETLDFGPRTARADAWRHRAGALIGASAAEISLVGNTVQAINIVANGISWRSGDNVVGASVEFPANVYPWQRLTNQGVEVRLVPGRGELLDVDDVLASIDSHTRLVSLSLVQYSSGQRIAAARIGEECRRRGVYFLLDAIQAVGAQRIDVGQLGVDFLAAGGHKWMLGPLGTGLFYCRRALLDELAVASIGHKSMKPRAGYLPYRIDLRDEAARFEGGALNSLGLYGLDASTEMLLQIGLDQVEARIAELTALAREGLASRGYTVVTPAEPDARSGIVSFRSSRHAPDAIRDKLRAAAVVVSPVGDVNRIAPHFYNTPEDIDRALAALP